MQGDWAVWKGGRGQRRLQESGEGSQNPPSAVALTTTTTTMMMMMMMAHYGVRFSLYTVLYIQRFLRNVCYTQYSLRMHILF